MPVARYFLFVGGVLLALLFARDAFAPQQAAVAGNAAPSIDKTVVRIHSDQKWPERVVYDTSLPTIVPPGGGDPDCRGSGCAGRGRQRPGSGARHLSPVRPGRGQEASKAA